MSFTTDSAPALGFVFIDRGLRLFETDGGQVDGWFAGQRLDIGCEGLEALVDRLVLFRKTFVELNDLRSLILRESAMAAVLLDDAVEGSDRLVVVHADGADLVGDGLEHAVGDGLHSQTFRLAVGLQESEVGTKRTGERFGAWSGMADGCQIENHRQGDEGAEVVAAARVEGIGSGVESGQVGGREADRDALGGGLDGVWGRRNV